MIDDPGRLEQNRTWLLYLATWYLYMLFQRIHDVNKHSELVSKRDYLVQTVLVMLL
jgi:hypothetical protein